MRADLLHVVTAIANPLRWSSRQRLYRDFERHMLDSGVQLTVVECAYGDRPHALTGTAGVRHVGVRAKTMVWTKENLLNLGIARLPDAAKYVAWIDADIRFRRPDWAAEAVHALQFHDVIQPWSDCYDLGPNDEHVQVHRSFCRQWRDGKPVGQPYGVFAHPGYAWAATRQALEWTGGLIETAPLGAADHHMALALVGRVASSIPGTAGRRLPPPAAGLAGAGRPARCRQHRQHRWHDRARLARRQGQPPLHRALGRAGTSPFRPGDRPAAQHLGRAGAGREQAGAAARHRGLFPPARRGCQQPGGGLMNAVLSLALSLAPELAMPAFGPDAARIVQQVEQAVGRVTGTPDAAAAEQVVARDPLVASALRLELARIASTATGLGTAGPAAAATASEPPRAPPCTPPSAPAVISVLVLAAFAGAVWASLTRSLPPGSQTMATMLLGTLAAMATSVVSYWVGSSAGSAQKTDLLFRARPPAAQGPAAQPVSSP